MASLTLHGGLIALALLLGGQASLPQEKVYRVSLAQMTAGRRPPDMAGPGEGSQTLVICLEGRGNSRYTTPGYGGDIGNLTQIFCFEDKNNIHYTISPFW